MKRILDWVRLRLLPAALTAAGVSLLGAGLLTYGTPAQATTPSPSPVTSSAPGASPTLLPFPTPGASAAASASPAAARVATRVVVPALKIDLPVVRPPNDPNAFPYCNVAMYFQMLHQPGEPGATYLYAHARTGMFLPILTASQVNGGARMIGMLVQVYTSDDRLYLYEVVEVRRHVLTLDAALAETSETLWLQTSEGPKLPAGQVGPKVQLVAQPLSSGPADHAVANPTPRPVTCQ
jgi:hypothetical protein